MRIPRTVVLIGILLLGGLVLSQAVALAGLGGLPGDFTFHWGMTQVYVPLTSGILLSVVLSLVFWFLAK